MNRGIGVFSAQTYSAIRRLHFHPPFVAALPEAKENQLHEMGAITRHLVFCRGLFRPRDCRV
jgi:hypothetical protein